MASVRLRADNSIWLARFVDASGKKREVSTGTTHRREAQKIADAFEAASQRKFTVAHVQRTLRELMADATATPVPGSSVGEWIKQWIDRRRVENAASTIRYYETSARRFGEWCSVNLPHGNKTEMAAVTSIQIDAFRSWAMTDVSISTVNHQMKFVRHVFDSARREGLLLESPCSTMKPIRRHEVAESRPFTIDEVKKLLLVADDEWRSMILFAFYTGQRLGDICALDWRDLNLDRGEWSFLMRKTGRRMVIPLAIPLIAPLASIPLLDRLGPVHPRAFGKLSDRTGTNAVSAEFFRLAVRAGVVGPRPITKLPGKTDSRRRRGSVSFHSFRHTATSMLRDSGAPQGVAMELIGHASATVHRHYAHLGSDTLRRAVSLLPAL